ncbi:MULTISPECIES: flotillin family protein [Ruminococcus]|uniref:Band 7 protein n=1 Tax=Ruminococcus albus (strain ATCC 27210 / DSM 20455 / JCM 14654 / NCDO 2250 / 7) TaxID=697329 RepID=E6UDF3_RUMA7|nr:MULTISPECIES: flotillin family protein [Ruminococcus]ADU22836.1 band 7 protein [Ruminococcus albus 7 = DSM 20455]MCR5021974.1 flotillin family protein [Ruminococcus sp.]
MGTESIIIICVIVAVLFAALMAILSRYRKCPSDKVLVIYGKVGTDKNGQARSARCIHGGAAFIMPVIQSYEYMDLTPISINVDLKNALSKQNIRIDVPSRFTVGISTEPGIMQNAAERLLGLKLMEIQELAKDIIFGQLRLIIATMDIEEINSDRDKFLLAVSNNVEIELKKIGLKLINVNVTDITDESGYLEALGKEAAAKAINDAKKSVAEKHRDGEIGQSHAQKEQRIEVAAANADAIKGENDAKVAVAQSEAERREREAESLRKATAAEAVQAAKAKQEAYIAQQEAELTRAELEKATQKADVIVKAEISKQQAEIQAEAQAEVTRRKAKGEADAIFAKMEAEAKGNQEILTKQAEGLKQIVAAAGGDADAAVRLIIADKMEQLIAIQVEAIKNIKIDKITVWDSGANGGQGGGSTANFLSGLMKSVPPLNDLFEQAGMSLPEFLGKDMKDALEKSREEAIQRVAAEEAEKLGSNDVEIIEQ